MGSQGATATIRLGAKNRFVVVKTTQTFSNTPNVSGGLNVESAGSSNFNGYASLNLERPERDPNNREYVRYEVRILAEEPDTRETSVRLVQTAALPESQDLQCKVGAKTTYNGQQMSIVSIEKSEPADMRFPGQKNRAIWTIRIKASGTAARPVTHSFGLAGADGRPIRHVNEKGMPISEEEHQRIIQQMIERTRNSPSREGFPTFMGVVGGARTSPGGITDFIVFVDPAKISKLRISGFAQKQIDITGIPMDPRG